MYENPKLTGATNARIVTFVDWFIRSEYVQNWASDKDSDFINEPDRAWARPRLGIGQGFGFYQ